MNIMISKKLDNFFHDNLWMIDEREYRWFQDKNNKVVPTPVLNGKLSHSDYVKRCEEFLDKAEKALDKQALHELATMFKAADIDLGSKEMNTRWQNYLTLSEVFQYPNGEYNADAFDKEIIQSRNPVDPDPELTDKLDNRSGKEYTGHDAVYMIVGQVKIPASSKPADTYYYSTLKNNWVKDVHEGTQYDSKADAEEDLWDAENLFIDDYSRETRFGWKYQLAVKIVGRKPRKGDHKNLNMNIYEKLNKINDTESLSEKYNVKNVKELKKLQESVTDRAIAWYVDSGTAEDEAHEYSAENPDDWNAGNPEFVARALDWYENSYYAELDSQDYSIFRKPEKFQHDGVNYAKKLHLSDSTNEYAVYNIQQYDNWKNSINHAYNKLKNMFPDMIKWERGYGKEGYKYFVITTDSVYQIDNSFNVVKRLTESSNGKQDVRHEAQRIHDELIKKGYTDEEIDSIISILHTAAINNFEPARPKLKAAFPDLDI